MKNKLLFAAMLAGFVVAPGHAATFIVNGSNKLTGANGVEVLGGIYNVEFIDSTCSAIFGGCDEQSDFLFQTSTEALAAAQALIDQVFLDGPQGNFDTHPELTLGCTALHSCMALVPYQLVVQANPAVNAGAAINGPLDVEDYAAFSGAFVSDNLGTYQAAPLVTYARFTLVQAPPPPPAVPEPTSWALMIGGLGLVGATIRRRTTVAFS